MQRYGLARVHVDGADRMRSECVPTRLRAPFVIRCDRAPRRDALPAPCQRVRWRPLGPDTDLPPFVVAIENYGGRYAARKIRSLSAAGGRAATTRACAG